MAWLMALAVIIPCRGLAAAAAIGPEPAVLQAVLKQFHVEKFTVQNLESVDTPGEMEISLLLGDEAHRIVLRKHSLRTRGFRVVAQDANGLFREVDVGDSRTYRGYVIGQSGSSVSASISEFGVSAVVRLGDASDTTWVVEPLRKVLRESDAGLYVVYSSADLPVEFGVCGNHDVPAAKNSGTSSILQPATSGLNVTVCRIACDADYEYYVLNGSSLTDAAADIETIVNGVSAIYERDARVSFQITQILIRSVESDPYSATTVDGLLGQFRLDWKNNHPDIPRDLAHLFTGRSFGTVLGNSYVDQLCPGADHYSLVRSRWVTDLGKRIALSAHEIAHSFDAFHCDDEGDPRCRIMCSNLGGCSNGYHSFEDANIVRIRSVAAAASCLTAGTVMPKATALPFVDNFNGATYPPQAARRCQMDGY